MKITTETLDNGITKVKVNKIIDYQNSDEFATELNNVINEENNKIIIDFIDSEYLDSSGIGVFISAKTKLDRLCGKLVLINLQDQVRQIFQLSKLIGLFKVCDTETDAINLISSN